MVPEHWCYYFVVIFVGVVVLLGYLDFANGVIFLVDRVTECDDTAGSIVYNCCIVLAPSMGQCTDLLFKSVFWLVDLCATTSAI